MSLRFLTPISGGSGFMDLKSLRLSATSSGTIADNPGFSTAMSVSCWINTTQTLANTPFVTKLTVSGSWSWNFSLGTGGVLRMAISSDGTFAGGGFTNFTGTAIINDGNWHHIAATFLGGSTRLTLYVDGVQDAQTTSAQASLFTSAIPIDLGTFSGGPTGVYDGMIDWISLYSTELSSSDITSLYNLGAPPPFMTLLPSYSTCTMWLPVGEGSDSTSTLFDQKNSNNATLTGVSSGDFTNSIP